MGLFGHGSRSWTRTNDPLINSQLLYQLSYSGMSTARSCVARICVPCARRAGPRGSRVPTAALLRAALRSAGVFELRGSNATRRGPLCRAEMPTTRRLPSEVLRHVWFASPVPRVRASRRGFDHGGSKRSVRARQGLGNAHRVCRKCSPPADTISLPRVAVVFPPRSLVRHGGLQEGPRLLPRPFAFRSFVVPKRERR